MPTPIILVDGNNFLYRAYYSTVRAGMTNSKNEPTGAVKVYINMLGRLAKKYKNSPFAVVFDASVPSFRKELFPEYKATRKHMPDDLKSQVPWVHRYIKSRGIPLIIVPGVEADDVLGSYAVKAEEVGIPLVIESGDKDLAQLVAKNIRIEDTMNNIVLDRNGVIRKFGVPPELIRDFLTLKGDKVDNVPGMTGIGDVSACAVLNGIGDIDAIKEHLDEVSTLKFRGAGKFKERFLAEEQQIRLSRELVTIKTDVPLPVPLEELTAPNVANYSELKALYDECEFSTNELKVYLEPGSDIDSAESKEPTGDATYETKVSAPENNGCALTQKSPKFGLGAGKTQTDLDASAQESESREDPLELFPKFLSEIAPKIVLSEQELDELAKDLSTSKCFSIYAVPGKGHFITRSIVGFGIRTISNSYYVPLGHQYLGTPVQIEKNRVAEVLSKFILSNEIVKIAYDIKELMHALDKLGLKIAPPFHDVMLSAHIVDASLPYDLAFLSEKYISQKVANLESLIGTGKNKRALEDVTIEEVAAWASSATRALIMLENRLFNEISKDAALLNNYEKEELPLTRVLYRMEHNGVVLDCDILNKQSQELHKKLDDAHHLLNVKAGHEININSPKQVGELLFEVMKLPSKAKTKSGSYSTSEEVLEELATKYEEPRLILECRGYSKLLSTYTEKLPEMILKETGRLHGRFNQAGTVTGRLSSSDPNLQNIPVRNQEGREIRKAFAAKDGYVIVAADYSQIELRLMAHIAGELNMIKAFNEGKDIHASTAAEMHGIPLEQVTPELRRSAKAINFGLIYGMSAFGLAKQLGIDTKTAKQYVDLYFAEYPGVKEYMSRTLSFVKENGYVETFSGRKLRFPGLLSNSGLNSIQKKAIERAAINAPMQGSAAEIIKRAMIEIDDWLDTVSSDNIKLILQVHDELVFEVREEFAEEYSKIISKLMTNTAKLRIPLEVSIGIGKNWSDAH